jgi:hypothetical protein
MRRILVASNAIKTIDNEMINLIKLHYLLFELHSTRPKFVVFIWILLPRRWVNFLSLYKILNFLDI